MPKKVVMITGPVHPVPPFLGAAVETWMYEVSKRLVGYEPHIISIAHPFLPDREYRDGIYFHRIRFGRLYRRLFQKITKLDPSSYARRAAAIISEIAPDVCHIHQVNEHTEAILGLLPPGTRGFIHQHNERKMTGELRLDTFVGCCRFIVEKFKGGGVRADRYEVLYNGVDGGRYFHRSAVPNLVRETRERFSIAPDDFVVLFVGRLSPEKGAAKLIEAAGGLGDIPNLKVVCVGEVFRGKTGNDRVAYTDKVMEMARAHGDRVVFTDVFPHSKMPYLYLLGDMVVVPSDLDAFPMVPIEAMATGLPVVMTRIGGMTEYVEDGVNGLWIDDNDQSKDIAGKIRRLYGDKALRDALGAAGRKTVEERFTWDRISVDVEKFYRTL